MRLTFSAARTAATAATSIDLLLLDDIALAGDLRDRLGAVGRRPGHRIAVAVDRDLRRQRLHVDRVAGTLHADRMAGTEGLDTVVVAEPHDVYLYDFEFEPGKRGLNEISVYAEWTRDDDSVSTTFWNRYDMTFIVK